MRDSTERAGEGEGVFSLSWMAGSSLSKSSSSELSICSLLFSVLLARFLVRELPGAPMSAAGRLASRSPRTSYCCPSDGVAGIP